MGAHSFEDLLRHVGHKIVCVSYGLPTKEDQRTYLKKVVRKKQLPNNVATECETCNEVLLDFDRQRCRNVTSKYVR